MFFPPILKTTIKIDTNHKNVKKGKHFPINILCCDAQRSTSVFGKWRRNDTGVMRGVFHFRQIIRSKGKIEIRVFAEQ